MYLVSVPMKKVKRIPDHICHDAYVKAEVNDGITTDITDTAEIKQMTNTNCHDYSRRTV